MHEITRWDERNEWLASRERIRQFRYGCVTERHLDDGIVSETQWRLLNFYNI